MTYYYAKTVKGSFDDVISRTIEALKVEGFGLLTDIDVKATLKKRLNVGFHNYRILGACNPPFAYRALQEEDKIGTMLPCNVIVQERADRLVEVAAVDPIASMQAVENPGLYPVAVEVQKKLQRMIDSI
jgi:uncharacterized protein (DUF302 family)